MARILNGTNLGGWLPLSLDMFTSIRTIDLSDNHIAGSIPNRLPRTLKRLYICYPYSFTISSTDIILLNNQLSGTIPNSLSDLPLLSTMALNNMLKGELSYAFNSLTGLTNLDLSSNKLKGQLPSSMGSLSLLKTPSFL